MHLNPIDNNYMLVRHVRNTAYTAITAEQREQYFITLWAVSPLQALHLDGTRGETNGKQPAFVPQEER